MLWCNLSYKFNSVEPSATILLLTFNVQLMGIREALCDLSYREAGLNAMTRGSPAGVELSDFHHAMSTIQPSAMREIYIDVPKVCSPI